MRKYRKRIRVSGKVPNRVPNMLKRRYAELLGPEGCKKFLKYMETEHVKALRVNSLKAGDPQKIIDDFMRMGFKLAKIDLFENAYAILESPAKINYFKLDCVTSGYAYVQDASSMLAPVAMDIPAAVSDGFSVLDVAAAPGSKTTQIAELMKNRGTIVANDVNYGRLKDLKRNIGQYGVKNAKVMCVDGRSFDFGESFDRILVDAPCSGTGILRKNKESLNNCSPRKIKNLQENQLRMLNNTFRFLKRNGVLVYSTCSLEPEENELCVKKFLEANEDARLLNAAAAFPAITQSFAPAMWFNEEIPDAIRKNVLRIHPQQTYFEGFFIAKIAKA